MEKEIQIPDDARITNPVTETLRRRGMTKRGLWIVSRLEGYEFNANSFFRVCDGYYRNEEMEKFLKERGLHHLIQWKDNKDGNKGNSGSKDG